jgi:transposase InsO family protein
VNRDFTSAVPGLKMAGDITCIQTWEGWAYLATVIDCATRKVIGWAVDDNYRTPLISAAMQMAARNLDLPPDAVFHSGRGSNYTSADFAAVLSGLDIRQSVGRTGICPLTGQSPGSCRSATRHVVRGCLPAGDVSDTPVRHEHGGFLAAA